MWTSVPQIVVVVMVEKITAGQTFSRHASLSKKSQILQPKEIVVVRR